MIDLHKLMTEEISLQKLVTMAKNDLVECPRCKGHFKEDQMVDGICLLCDLREEQA